MKKVFMPYFLSLLLVASIVIQGTPDNDDKIRDQQNFHRSQ